MSTGKKKALQQHWETRGHGLVNYENFLPQIQTNSAAAVSAPAAGGTLSRGAGLLPATSPFYTTSRPPHRLVLRTLEIIDGPSQDAGVHAGAALQRRVLLQIWIQVQKGHKRIWHNLPWEPSRSMCRKGDRCDAFADARRRPPRPPSAATAAATSSPSASCTACPRSCAKTSQPPPAIYKAACASSATRHSG